MALAGGAAAAEASTAPLSRAEANAMLKEVDAILKGEIEFLHESGTRHRNFKPWPPRHDRGAAQSVL